MKHSNLLDKYETPHHEWMAKVKLQSTVLKNGDELRKKVLHDLVDDTDWDVSQAAKKLLGLERDRYAKMHGAPKEKETKKKKKSPAVPPPTYINKEQSKVFLLSNLNMQVFNFQTILIKLKFGKNKY